MALRRGNGSWLWAEEGVLFCSWDAETQSWDNCTNDKKKHFLGCFPTFPSPKCFLQSITPLSRNLQVYVGTYITIKDIIIERMIPERRKNILLKMPCPGTWGYCWGEKKVSGSGNAPAGGSARDKNALYSKASSYLSVSRCFLHI